MPVNSGEMKQAGFDSIIKMADATKSETLGILFNGPVREVETRDALVAFCRIRKDNRTFKCVLPNSRRGESIIWREVEELTGAEMVLLPPWFPVPVN